MFAVDGKLLPVEDRKVSQRSCLGRERRLCRQVLSKSCSPMARWCDCLTVMWWCAGITDEEWRLHHSCSFRMDQTSSTIFFVPRIPLTLPNSQKGESVRFLQIYLLNQVQYRNDSLEHLKPCIKSVQKKRDSTYKNSSNNVLFYKFWLENIIQTIKWPKYAILGLVHYPCYLYHPQPILF